MHAVPPPANKWFVVPHRRHAQTLTSEFTLNNNNTALFFIWEKDLFDAPQVTPDSIKEVQTPAERTEPQPPVMRSDILFPDEIFQTQMQTSALKH